MNQMTVVGNLTRDPEMTYTPAGIAITKFSVATSSGKTRDGKDRPAEFHNVVIFGTAEGKDGLAGVCAQYLKKGSKCLVQGPHQVNEWEDKEGIKRRSCQIMAREVEFLSPKEKSSSTGSE